MILLEIEIYPWVHQRNDWHLEGAIFIAVLIIAILASFPPDIRCALCLMRFEYDFIKTDSYDQSYQKNFYYKFRSSGVCLLWCFKCNVIYAFACIYALPQGYSSVTNWGRVMHICVGNPAFIGSDNGRRQAIIWTNAGILLIEPLGTNFSDILIKL